MTKDQFIKKWAYIFPTSMGEELDSLIASELAKATRPKPPFEKPFKVLGKKDGYYISDGRGYMVSASFEICEYNKADFICKALNKYEGE